ncbi:MAG: DUF3572 domain-containing protein [Rhodobacteraceae bacterium]|nr:DUF3572 domain-containing protein [Paracoccaceae bacterium]
MKQEQSEAVALRAMAWLVGDDENRRAFLAASGASGSELAAGAEEPDFLASVLEYLLSDDARVMAFCDDEGLAYEIPMQALSGLPGQDLRNWT